MPDYKSFDEVNHSYRFYPFAGRNEFRPPPNRPRAANGNPWEIRPLDEIIHAYSQIFASHPKNSQANIKEMKRSTSPGGRSQTLRATYGTVMLKDHSRIEEDERVLEAYRLLRNLAGLMEHYQRMSPRLTSGPMPRTLFDDEAKQLDVLMGKLDILRLDHFKEVVHTAVDPLGLN